MGNPTDQTIEQLAAEWPAFEFWIVKRLCGGPVYCARRHDDHSRGLSADSPAHLAEYLENEVSEPIDHGWTSGTCGTESTYSHPDDPVPVMDTLMTADMLRQMFPGWVISRTPGGVWCAEHTDSTAVRFLCAEQAWQLAMKIRDADVTESLSVTEPADVDDDVECEPNNLGFCRWCGRDLSGNADA